MKIMLGWKIRPAKVDIAGAIFIFNITLVPIVLIAFHNMALYALLICISAAFFYFIRVRDKEESEIVTNDDFYSKSNDDIF